MGHHRTGLVALGPARIRLWQSNAQVHPYPNKGPRGPLLDRRHRPLPGTRQRHRYLRCSAQSECSPSIKRKALPRNTTAFAALGLSSKAELLALRSSLLHSPVKGSQVSSVQGLPSSQSTLTQRSGRHCAVGPETVQAL